MYIEANRRRIQFLLYRSLVSLLAPDIHIVINLSGKSWMQTLCNWLNCKQNSCLPPVTEITHKLNATPGYFITLEVYIEIGITLQNSFLCNTKSYNITFLRSSILERDKKFEFFPIDHIYHPINNKTIDLSFIRINKISNFKATVQESRVRYRSR